MRYIPLTQGEVAVVDDADYPELSKHKWHLNRTGNGNGFYAARTMRHSEKIYMHREILRAPNNMQVDHINGCGLDNRRANLRLLSKSENVKRPRFLKE